MLAMMLPCLGAWAEVVETPTPVVELNYEQIPGSYPFELDEANSNKIFELTDLTIAVQIKTKNVSGRMALLATSDATQSKNTNAEGMNSRYVAYGMNGADPGYLASWISGDRFTGKTYSGVTANTRTLVVVYVINPTNKTFKVYVNGQQEKSWTHTVGFMDGYEIATPGMVKEDHTNAKIYIGGGKHSGGNGEVFNGVIKGIKVYSGALTAEQIADIQFPEYIVGEEDFVNGEVYTFVTSLGWMGAMEGDDYVISTAKKTVTPEATKDNKNFQWTVYKSENGNYYLYNLGKEMFMGVQSKNTTHIPFTILPGKNLTFKKSNKVGYPIMFSTNNNAVVNHTTSNSYNEGVISWTGGWNNLNDNGNCHKVELVGNLTDETRTKIENLVAERENTGYFRLKGNSDNYIDASSIYNKATAKVGQMSMKSEEKDNLAGTIFYCDDDNKFLNYATGTHIRVTREIGNASNTDGNNWNIFVSTQDKYKLLSNDLNWLHDSGDRADRCSSESDHGPTTHSWTIEKVTSLPVTITAAKYATFYAPVAVEVPAGVTAHTVTINGEWATLSEALEVIPANTGVVLYSETAGTYDFAITEDVEAIEGNALRGTAATTYFTEAGTYYALGLDDKGVVGFYKDAFNNNRFQNNSHKAYLFVPSTSTAAALKFRFEDGTTAIESVLNNGADANAPIFDLSGRRVMNTVKGGIYIQNGKKFIVK